MTTEQTPETTTETIVVAEPFRPMIPLVQFKEQLGIKSLALMQGKGRMFANINGKSIVVGSKTDLSKELFVLELSRTAEGEYIAPRTAYVLVNSEKVHVAATI